MSRRTCTLASVPHGVVCISSQTGAGAQEAAQLVADLLDFRLIDEEIVTVAAVEAGVDTDVMADVERRRSRVLRVMEGLGTAGAGAGYMVPGADIFVPSAPPSDALRGMIRSVIDDTAAKGSAVILQHAASLALAEREDVLRVLLTAPLPTRERRVASALGVDEKQAAREIKQSDNARADYLKRFYGVDAELPTHYDLVVNTDVLAVQEAVSAILAAVHG